MALIKARTATTVPMKDGRHVAVNAGDSVDLDEVKTTFSDLWEAGDRWLHSIFEATSSASKGDGSGLVFEDPVQRAMAEHEALVRERVQMPREHRQGAPDVPVQVTDRFRTLPTSGADLEADHRYAELDGADPAKGFDYEGKQAEEEDRLGHAAGSDERAMPGDQPAGSAAASAAVPSSIPGASAGSEEDDEDDD